MDVQLLTVTPNALDVLLYTKNTRLTMNAAGLGEVAAWPAERKEKELRYMRNTIQSSWEFVDYVFAITGVTRAFTHQLVRHRVGTSFAQQAQRVVNMEGFFYLATGEELNMSLGEVSTRDASIRDGWARAGENPSNIYDETMQRIDSNYNHLLELGVKPQDARGVLPTNICTNIIFKANLRTLHDMALKRLCVKAQGEFQDVFRLLVDRVAEVHPWAEDFLRVQCAWNGTCLFPSLPVADCHVKPHVYNPETTRSYGADAREAAGFPGADRDSAVRLYTTEEIYHLHRSKRTEIQPRVAGTPPLKCSECGYVGAGTTYAAGDPCPEGRVGSCSGTLE